MSLLDEILSDVEQGSDMWNKIRLGKFTSSEIHRLIFKKGALTDKALKYIQEKAAEIMTGVPNNSFDNAATTWGHEQEPIAAKLFSEKTELELTECGFVMLNEYFGGSPDRLIGVDGLIEIKCPFNSGNHVKHCMLKDQEDLKAECPEYFYQIQSNLIVTERDYAFFVSYDPRNEKAPLFILLVKRDEKEIELINNCVEKGIEELKTILKKLAA